MKSQSRHFYHSRNDFSSVDWSCNLERFVAILEWLRDFFQIFSLQPTTVWHTAGTNNAFSQNKSLSVRNITVVGYFAKVGFTLSHTYIHVYCSFFLACSSAAHATHLTWIFFVRLITKRYVVDVSEWTLKMIGNHCHKNDRKQCHKSKDIKQLFHNLKIKTACKM